MPPTAPVTHNASTVNRNGRRLVFISLIVSFHIPLFAADPPADLLKRLLAHETATEQERGQYAYRQQVRVEELETSGRKRGEYRETRDVIFTADGKRHEDFIGKPFHSLDRLKLTDEDFRDIREVQPFLFTSGQLHIYRTRFKGEELIDGVPCWVVQVDPRQILDGQRLFEGLVWVHQQEFAVVRMEGRAVPQILSRKQENLFPRFTTTRRKVDGRFWFPDKTVGDDVLNFRTGSLRMRLAIDYSNYKRFTAESTITFKP